MSPQEPTGLKVQYKYNGYGHLDRVCKFNTSCVSGVGLYWRADAQNAEGQWTQATFGNGVTTQQTFNANTGRIQAIGSSSPSGALNIQDYSFVFDTLGNLTQRVKREVITGVTQTYTENFGYDPLNRLTATTLNSAGTLSSKTYQYDALGNLTSKTGIGAYFYGEMSCPMAGPHAVTTAGGKQLCYDANGNQVQGWNFTQNRARTLAWTSYNKPRTISEGTAALTFYYGADRDRFLQEQVDRKTIYVGSLYEEQVQGTLTTHIHYIQAGGLPVAIYRNFSDNATPETRYLHRDHLGSVTEITDETANLVESLAYDPHGKRRETDWKDALTPLTALETARSFTHHEYLDEVSLIHMNGRVYDPDLGRFLSADPFIQFPEYSQSFNRYSYVLNNPLSFVDPSGYGIFGDIFDFIGDVFDAFVDVAKGFLDAVVNFFSPEAILGRLLTVAAAIACGPAGPVCAAAVAGGYTAATGGGITDILLAAVTAYNGVAGVEAQIPQEFVTGLKAGYVIDKFVNNQGDGTPGEGQTLEDTGNIVAQASGGGSLDQYGGGKFMNAAETMLLYAFGTRDAEADTTASRSSNMSIDEVVQTVQSEFPDAEIRITGRSRTIRRQAELMAERLRVNEAEFLRTYTDRPHIREMVAWARSNPNASSDQTIRVFDRIIRNARATGAIVSNHLSDTARDISWPLGVVLRLILTRVLHLILTHPVEPEVWLRMQPVF